MENSHVWQAVSPSAPAAALTASQRPSVAAAGAAIAATQASPGRTTPLWEEFWLPATRPRCVGGSWPDSQSRGGQGRGGGGGVGCLLVASFFLAGAGAGMTDSSRVRLAAGSSSRPPLARSAISFLAATLLASANLLAILYHI
jgi:hypothetical protein